MRAFGLQLGRHVTQPRRQLDAHALQAVVAPATAIRPLEKFLVPTALDGSQGLYRRPQAQCLLKANNDHQAILAWLRAKHGLTLEQKTQLLARRRQRATGSEAGLKAGADSGTEQGLDWLQALSHTERAYPLPRSHWCGERARWSPLWRLFEGPLSASAQRHAVTILKNLYGFLVEVIGPLSAYLASRGLAPDPEDIGNQGAHVLGKASDAAERAPGLNGKSGPNGRLHSSHHVGLPPDPREGIAATTFYDQAKASTHWMRHSHASHAIASGMPIEIAQQNLGHASLATTTVYVTTEQKRRLRAVEAFWKR